MIASYLGAVDLSALVDYWLCRCGRGLTAPPMSVLWHTIGSPWCDEKLYTWAVFISRNSLETTPVTGSLLVVAPKCRLATLGDCRIALHLSHVLADLLLCAVDFVSRTVLVNQFVTIMATG